MTDGTYTMSGQDRMHCYIKPLSWTAIIAGALIAVGLSFLLNLFSIAIGLSFITTTKEGVIALAAGGFLGLLLGTTVTTFVSGFAAGYLGRSCCPKHNLGVLYGFTTWCLALVLAALLAVSIGHYISYYSDAIANPTMIIFTSDHPTTANTVQRVANDLAISSFLVFVLFFVGALSSCFGGFCAMTCCKEDNCSVK